ncbi:MAG: uroporphyrinogen decarboxylase family protein [Gemmatimonadota bacterium]|nr:uroporphyrinogen decarboxylase family protein [Gemmatimonadota bacterium]
MNRQMTSRERVLAAVELREPDRVPIDFGSTLQTGIMAASYHELKELLGLGGETFVYDIYQMLAEIEQPVRERMHSDVVALRYKTISFGVPNEGKKDWTLNNGTMVKVSGAFDPEIDAGGNVYILNRAGERIAHMPPGGFYFDSLEKGPGAAHLDPDKWEMPLLDDEELRYLEQQAGYWHAESDYAVIAELKQVELFFGLGGGGFDNWLVTLMTEQAYVRELYEKAIEGMCANFDLYYQATGGKFDIAKFNDDFGMQSGEFANPELFRSLVLPCYKKFIDHIKATDSRLKIFQHCCGSIFNVLGDMIDIGVEIINPVQTSAENMAPKALKAAYGDRVCFWGGGVENQGVLPFGTPKEVAAQVEERLRIFAPGGGFVFNTIHNIQTGTPPENILTAFDTAFEKGLYR